MIKLTAPMDTSRNDYEVGVYYYNETVYIVPFTHAFPIMYAMPHGWKPTNSSTVTTSDPSVDLTAILSVALHSNAAEEYIRGNKG